MVCTNVLNGADHTLSHFLSLIHSLLATTLGRLSTFDSLRLVDRCPRPHQCCAPDILSVVPRPHHCCAHNFTTVVRDITTVTNSTNHSPPSSFHTNHPVSYRFGLGQSRIVSAHNTTCLVYVNRLTLQASEITSSVSPSSLPLVYRQPRLPSTSTTVIARQKALSPPPPPWLSPALSRKHSRPSPGPSRRRFCENSTTTTKTTISRLSTLASPLLNSSD